MKNKRLIIPAVLVSLLSLLIIHHSAIAESPSERTIDAIVSTQWLAENNSNPDILKLDVRNPDLYNSGHIPGSINVPAFGNFFLCLFDPDCGLWMEFPPDEDLIATIGKAGITPDSRVVIIGRTSDSQTGGPAIFGITMAARVALTLIYAGVRDVIILDGGYDKWAAEDRTISTDPVMPTAVKYTGKLNTDMIVPMSYVQDKLFKSTIVDTRDADVYYGIEQTRDSKKAGHIPSAKNLPAPWFWTATEDESGKTTYITWKDVSEINEIALTVLGNDMSIELIDYCGVGGYASPAWYLLTQVVGYKNVKFYDGSFQEWSADPDAPVVKYRYE